MTILNEILPYITLIIGFCIGLLATRVQLKNTYLTIEIKQKEAETKKLLVETAQTIAKTEEKGGGVKIRSQQEQAVLYDEERKRVQELLSDDSK